ncbi:aspartate aminotransferase family protein [Roseomonas sp. 18066]|uniref:aminotransferase family protein n=1 Tax=Roseomonas sp. 18066 TaxID=2681412 RepID=UPI00135B2743|nr:aspartate aminotransferase family protein [Roseomonas sp. 18066]
MDSKIDHHLLRQPVEQAALDHVWIHSAQWNDLEQGGKLKVIDRAEGSFLYDSHGRRYFDALSGLYVVNVGHGRAEIADAIGAQAKRLAYVSSATMTNRPAAELADRLASLTPGDLNRIFYCSGGSEAVESALKIAKQIQTLRGFPARRKVIARKGGYHGATFGAMSVSFGRNADYFAPFMEGVSFIPSPNRYRNEFGLDGEAGDLRCAEALEAEILAQGADTVAAFIAEPISAANGTHVPSNAYWQKIREICTRHGVLMIADEVICGFGRTGSLFAMEQFGVVPDLMTMAKGLTSGYVPMGAVAVSEAAWEVFKDSDAMLAHLLTFGGQAVAAAAALANLDILQREGLDTAGLRIGATLDRLLAPMAAHPSVGDIRGRGALYVIDLVQDKATREGFGKGLAALRHPYIQRLSTLLEERGVLTRLMGTIQLVPPLVATDEELAGAVQAIDESLTIAEAEFGFK